MRIFTTIGLAVSAVLFLVGVAEAKKPKVYYPPTPEGLQRQVEDLVAVTQEGRSNLLTTHVSRLVIPAQRTWFAHTFGSVHSQPVADEYRKFSRDVEGLKKYLTEVVVTRRQTEVHVTELHGPDDPHARGLQKRAFLAMHRHQHLYEVKLTRPDEEEGAKLWSFVYVDGAFRFAGKMRALTKVPVEHR